MTLGTAHLALAVIAIASGACVLARRKEDLTHRRSGWLLAGSLLGVNVTALFIYDLTGKFGPFHVFAIVSLASVLLGVGHARFWWMVLAASGAVLGAGGLVITRQLPRTLRRQGPTAPTAR
jgi:uncharacterized membrane protein